MRDPYIDLTTGVLRNLLGVTDRTDLALLELDLSRARITELQSSPPGSAFDLKHFKAIHGHLFQDIFDWAGHTRTIGMSKREPLLGGASVAYPEPNGPYPDADLDSRLGYAFHELSRANNLSDIEDDPRFVAKLGHHMAEVWECHAFREGNTRTVVTFFTELIRSTGRTLNKFCPPNPIAFRDALVLATARSDYDKLNQQLAGSIVS